MNTQPISLGWDGAEHDQVVEQILANSTHSFVLFPSEEAERADQLRHHLLHSLPPTVGTTEEAKNEPTSSSHITPLRNQITLVVLDGTWREARRMRHSPLLAELKEIQLDPASIAGHQSLFVARQKSDVAERFSTLEAVALLFRELAPADCEEEALQPLREVAHTLLGNLKLTMDHLLLQAGMKDKTNFKRTRPSPAQPLPSEESTTPSCTNESNE